MKLFASLLFAPTALAFMAQQSPSSASSNSLQAAVDDMPGQINFMCKEFKFDPLDLATTYEPLLPWFREAEIKHGRTAMLAVVGFVVQDFVRLPGDAYSFASIPKTIDAHDTLLAMGWQSPMSQLLVWIGLWDLVVTGPAAMAAHNGEREPGGTSNSVHQYLLCRVVCDDSSCDLTHTRTHTRIYHAHRLRMAHVQTDG